MARYFLNVAFTQIGRYRAQSILVILGVSIGVANIILLMSMTDMGRRQTLGLLEDFGARMLIIVPYVDLNSGPLGIFSQANATGHVPKAAYEALQNCEALELRSGSTTLRKVSSMLNLSGHVSSEQQSWYTVVSGATTMVVEFGGFELAEGRWIDDQDEARASNIAVLGDTAKRRLFPGSTALGKQITVKDQHLTVVGVLKPKASNSLEEHDKRVFIPLSTAQQLYGFEGAHGILARYREGLKPDQAMDAARECIATALNDGERVEDVVSVFTIKEATRVMDSTLSIFRTVLLGVASIALIVAGIGIMNVMLIRVMRRRVEIGIRRAVGATTHSIVMQFLIESAAQAALGAILGLMLAATGLAVFADYADWDFYISPRTLAVALLFGIVIGLVFGAYPAYTAAKVDPINSLRYEM